MKVYLYLVYFWPTNKHLYFFSLALSIVTLGIIWDTDSPSANYIADVMDCITENLYMIDVSFNLFLNNKIIIQQKKKQ